MDRVRIRIHLNWLKVRKRTEMMRGSKTIPLETNCLNHSMKSIKRAQKNHLKMREKQLMRSSRCRRVTKLQISNIKIC